MSVQHATETAARVAWQPLPGSQALALSCPCNRILYHGTRGPGKTDAQLMYFRRFVGLGYGAAWNGIIFDRTYKMLDDLVKKSRRWFPRMKGPKARFNKSAMQWEWSTGEILAFRHMKDIGDYENYHGHEYPFIGWNEITKHPTSELYDTMMSCNRTSFVPDLHSPDLENPLPPIPLVVFSTTNPFGPGHLWVRRKLINVSPSPGSVYRVQNKVFNPQTQQDEVVTRTQTHIFGSYRENKYLPPEYVLELDSISDPMKREAWLRGNWDIDAGGALEGVWDRRVHVLPRFKIPSGWKIDRSFDWGSTHPFSVGWWATANGEEVKLPGGRIFAPVKGSLIRIAEWYGSEEIGTNKGIVMGPRKVALGIKEREAKFLEHGWIKTPVKAGPADNQIRAVQDEETHSIESRMADEGVKWTSSDKRAGSRKIGLQLLRDALENALGEVDDEGIRTCERPGLYVMENCQAWIETVPKLPRDEDDPDDVDTAAEDHAYDDTRYRVLANAPDFATSVDIKLSRD